MNKLTLPHTMNQSFLNPSWENQGGTKFDFCFKSPKLNVARCDRAPFNYTEPNLVYKKK